MALWVILVLRMATAWMPMPSMSLPVVSQEQHYPVRVGLSEPPGQVVLQGSRMTAPPPMPQPALPWTTLIFALWVLGASSLLLWTIQSNARLWWAVRKGRVLTQQPILDLLERCKDELGVRTVLGIVVTERVPSPALFGLVRPRLLVPSQVLETLSAEELRHVFLHELAHLKHWDILMSWVCALLQVIHWFNPFVWLAFRRMRADRELACDQTALRSMSPRETGDYGRTLIKLLEILPPPVTLPSLAGVMEEACTFTWRIKMITRFMATQGRPRWSPLSIGLLGVFTLSAFSFTLSARAQNPLHPLLAHPIQDKVDFPFVDDPQVIGTWRPQAFVPKPEAFTAGEISPQAKAIIHKWEKEMPYITPFSVRPGGETSSLQTWTKGMFLNQHEVERTASRYEVKTIKGADYLFMEFKNGDYTYRGMPPQYVVFLRESKIPVPASRVVDKVDYPFVNDPALLGAWHSVDFVKSPEDFQPGKQAWSYGGLALKELTILPEGKTTTSYTWTEGLILNDRNMTASRYTIRKMDGKPYLFMEWKSGDYTFRGKKPEYYVLTR
jgi:bla regulator protein BlaR1